MVRPTPPATEAIKAQPFLAINQKKTITARLLPQAVPGVKFLVPRKCWKSSLMGVQRCSWGFAPHPLVSGDAPSATVVLESAVTRQIPSGRGGLSVSILTHLRGPFRPAHHKGKIIVYE